jgi:hypothetical protein
LVAVQELGPDVSRRIKIDARFIDKPEFSRITPVIGVEACGAPIVKVLFDEFVPPTEMLNSALFTLSPSCAANDPVKTRAYPIKRITRLFIALPFKF